MTKQEYIEFHKAFCEDMKAITEKKNADYTGGSSDPFYNFRHVNTFGICSAEVGILTRMLDKVSRVVSFVNNGELKVKDESVQDTLKDLANYCAILSGYISDEKLP